MYSNALIICFIILILYILYNACSYYMELIKNNSIKSNQSIDFN